LQVLAINYQQDFAFIQMDSPAQADAAVRGEHLRTFMGNQLKVAHRTKYIQTTKIKLPKMP